MRRKITILLGIFMFIGIVGMACAGGNVPDGITYIHDDVHQVSCWTFTTDGEGADGAGISCLPDSQVANVEQLPLP